MNSASLTFSNPVFKWWHDWRIPRATNRDEAFRESTIRVTVAILFFATILSFLSSIPFFDTSASLVSYPTLMLIAAVLTMFSGIAVSKQRITMAGQFLVLTFLVSAGGITLIDGYWAGLVIPMYMLVVLIVALILPRSQLGPMSAISIFSFAVIALLQEESGRYLTILQDEEIVVSASSVIVNVVLIILIEAAFLRQLKREFDSRLSAVSLSLSQAEQARLEADRANRAKSEFLAGMSHELRTPLNAIIGYTDIMVAGMTGALTDKQTQLQGYIKQNATRLLAMINDTLDMARIEAKRIDLRLSRFSPEKELRQMTEGMESLARKKHIALHFQAMPGTPATVSADLPKIQQIFTNLLGNAIKFTSEGGVIVELGCYDPTRWYLKVTDTGIGIPEEALDQIFEMFQRVDHGSKQYEGTGLGLAISKNLVEFMDGEIRVHSEPKKGSTFTVILPCEVPMREPMSRE